MLTEAQKQRHIAAAHRVTTDNVQVHLTKEGMDRLKTPSADVRISKFNAANLIADGHAELVDPVLALEDKVEDLITLQKLPLDLLTALDLLTQRVAALEASHKALADAVSK